MQPASSGYLKGAAFGFAAASIWASWSVVTRLAVTTSLDASDIAALRFGVAGLLLSPVLVRRGLARDRLGWLGLGVLIAGVGAPYALVAAAGLRFAPAYDGGALNPGCMPLFVALLAAIVLGETLSTTRKLGLSMILAGAVIIVGWHAAVWSAAWSTSRSFGDALFLFAAFLSACFTVVMRQAKLEPRHATALVSTGSLVIYLPIYLALHGTRLAHMPVAELTVQAIFQGVLVTIVSLVLYGRAVAIGWRGVWRFGPGAVGAVCNTTPGGMAKRNRLGRHGADLRRCLSGKRRTVGCWGSRRCRDLAKLAEAHCAAAVEAIAACPRHQMRRAAVTLGLYRALLHELLARGWKHLEEPVRLLAWRKLALVLRHGPTGR